MEKECLRLQCFANLRRWYWSKRESKDNLRLRQWKLGVPETLLSSWDTKIPAAEMRLPTGMVFLGRTQLIQRFSSASNHQVKRNSVLLVGSVETFSCKQKIGGGMTFVTTRRKKQFVHFFPSKSDKFFKRYVDIFYPSSSEVALFSTYCSWKNILGKHKTLNRSIPFVPPMKS